MEKKEFSPILPNAEKRKQKIVGRFEGRKNRKEFNFPTGKKFDKDSNYFKINQFKTLFPDEHIDRAIKIVANKSLEKIEIEASKRAENIIDKTIEQKNSAYDSLNVQIEYNEKLAKKFSEKYSDFYKNIEKNFEERFKQKDFEIQNRIDFIELETKKNQEFVNNSFNKIKNDINIAREQINERLESELNSAVNEALERHKLSKAIDLWTGDAKNKQAQFLIGTFIVLFLLFIIPAIGIWQHSYIVNYIKDTAQVSEEIIENTASINNQTISDTFQIVGRIAFITLPIIFYFWLTRLVVRFTLRSLILMDDAKRREVYLEMFFKMSNEQEEGDLKIKLFDALLSPMPGHKEIPIDLPIAIDKVLARLKT